MSKIIGKSKHSEWAGLVRIRQVVSLEMKCIYREISSDDFGIDGTIEMSIPTADGQGRTKGGIVNRRHHRERVFTNIWKLIFTVPRMMKRSKNFVMATRRITQNG